ncbi:type I-E CRISPR-associated protein Cas5/CasD [Amycolatopsis panacis]|uniref:Type I-E CRISPR-associated protein Cas5/CasD n=1 Tax=Amycolatopsis panacis TaxID=2340917 RepID=A0A419I971_9PSEU|nr:type I-E CRISPR-associated protein Cas5/CasD [Amycolatopsis panacis]RJQ89103.1 type I-E CRISPR-associated protein Cas5/CasD [Amycolatopsis panacis]
MSTLLLRLGAPLQSWGTTSRFVRRNTDRAPSRSGILGLLAAAQGRRRTDPLEELLDLRVGVRIDQPGQLERDFHTARSRDGATSMPLSYRFYLADAVFAVAIEGEHALLEGVQQALRRPVFPLYLGRRSCPPAGELLYGIHQQSTTELLAQHRWLASPWVQKSHRRPTVDLDIVTDCAPGTDGAELVQDDPISFDPQHRRYGWRTIHIGHVTIPNPVYQPAVRAGAADSHDPMAAFEGIA